MTDWHCSGRGGWLYVYLACADPNFNTYTPLPSCAASREAVCSSLLSATPAAELGYMLLLAAFIMANLLDCRLSSFTVKLPLPTAVQLCQHTRPL